MSNVSGIEFFDCLLAFVVALVELPERNLFLTALGVVLQ